MIGVLAWLGLALGGSLGALSRWRLDLAVRERIVAFVATRSKSGSAHRAPAVPPLLGIATVNVLGCFLVGLLGGALAAAPGWRLVVSTGFLGGFTTFSTAVMDCWNLWHAGRRGAAILLLIGVWGCALVALFAGLGVAALLP
ncbi:fluoride efflux transporter FluC [Actinomyces culturomici]|uniref:fluoride efflux transporter FluC n=1 Tax=Actinomyces culturomici TaxID=1926276 RepID=UPI000E202F61|nr:CrcB family protein [Actinomyces culturomici]